MTWNDIALKHGTDKSTSYHGYMDSYYELLSKRDVTHLLEVGVFQGASLAMWEEIFPLATVVGVDNDPRCAGAGTHVEIADATDPYAMQAVAEQYGLFDVIVDDGSHVHLDVLAAFYALFPHLRKGGIYIIEDLDENSAWVRQFAKDMRGHIIDPPLMDGCLIWMAK